MTFYYGASDIQPMLDEFGVPVVFGGVTAKGIIETPDQRLFSTSAGGQIMGSVLMLIVQTETFPGIAQAHGQQPIEADGVNYKIIAAQKVDDGALTHVFITPLQA